MRINADFSKRALVRFDATDWVASPAAGVARRMLDRIGGEVARATSLVRFAPGSAFAAHTHDGGEEYLVLDGTFQDETGDFPTGMYVRNPPTSSHAPAARDGATILVKLHQFDPADRRQVEVDSGAQTWHVESDGNRTLTLHEDDRETVSMVQLAPGTAMRSDAPGGMEVFVIEGSLSEAGDTLTRWDWLRLPMGATLAATAGPDGARLWLKSGHLRRISAPGA